MSKIAIIGSGGWGTAVSLLLHSKGYKISLWSYFAQESENLKNNLENKDFLPGIPLPHDIDFTNDLASCVKDAILIVSAVPSKAVRSTAKLLAGVIDVENQPVLNISKGMDESTLMSLSQVIESEIPNVKIAVMSGPSHAEEVARGVPTTNVVSAHNKQLAEFIQDIFMYDTFRVYTNPDMLGVELGGSLKNVIALCAGICDGLGLGDNSKAALMTRGMTEIARLGMAMGAQLETFFGLTGVGDLIVTCTSMHSRNRRAGILIGQGKTAQEAIEEVKMVVEGVPATAAAYKLSQKFNIDMPITTQAYKILFEQIDPKKAVMELMTRMRKHEIEDVIRSKFKW